MKKKFLLLLTLSLSALAAKADQIPVGAQNIVQSCQVQWLGFSPHGQNRWCFYWRGITITVDAGCTPNVFLVYEAIAEKAVLACRLQTKYGESIDQIFAGLPKPPPETGYIAAYANLHFDKYMNVQAVATSADGKVWYYYCQSKLENMPNVLVVVGAHAEGEQFNSAYATALAAVESYLSSEDH